MLLLARTHTAPHLAEMRRATRATPFVALGPLGTNFLVKAVRAHLAQEQSPLLHGAKITGGGCGGWIPLPGSAEL